MTTVSRKVWENSPWASLGKQPWDLHFPPWKGWPPFWLRPGVPLGETFQQELSVPRALVTIHTRPVPLTRIIPPTPPPVPQLGRGRIQGPGDVCMEETVDSSGLCPPAYPGEAVLGYVAVERNCYPVWRLQTHSPLQFALSSLVQLEDSGTASMTASSQDPPWVPKVHQVGCWGSSLCGQKSKPHFSSMGHGVRVRREMEPWSLEEHLSP